ncbi:MAG: hypothetical protein QM706_00630 [Nitrospira sp.]
MVKCWQDAEQCRQRRSPPCRCGVAKQVAALRGSTYRSVHPATSLAAAMPGEQRVLARLDELAKRARRGGRVRITTFVGILDFILT